MPFQRYLLTEIRLEMIVKTEVMLVITTTCCYIPGTKLHYLTTEAQAFEQLTGGCLLHNCASTEYKPNLFSCKYDVVPLCHCDILLLIK